MEIIRYLHLKTFFVGNIIFINLPCPFNDLFFIPPFIDMCHMELCFYNVCLKISRNLMLHGRIPFFSEYLVQEIRVTASN